MTPFLNLAGLVVVLTSVGLFFWVRGMCKSCKADLAAGVGIFLLACGSVFAWEHIPPVAGVGGLMTLVGLATAVVVATKPECMEPTTRHDFSVLATGLIIIGFILSLVL